MSNWPKLSGMMLLLLAALSTAARADIPYAPVVVYYDNTVSDSYGKLYANLLRTYLGHFKTSITLADVSNYSKGDLSKYEAAFYIGSDYRDDHTYPLSTSFLDDVAGATHPVVWIYRNIWQLLWIGKYSTQFGLAYVNNSTHGYDQVTYKGEALFLSTNVSSFILLQPGSNVTIFAQAAVSTNPGIAPVPYAVRSSNLWYFADNFLSYDLYADRSEVFADLLHDILKTGAVENHRAYARIEDVNPNPESSPIDQVQAICAALKSIGVQPVIGVIPRYRYQAGGVDIPMSTARDFCRGLRASVRSGASCVNHGYTHESGVTNSANDYEFSQPNELALPYDSWDWAEARVTNAVHELLENGFPVPTWETPHYAASLTDYFVFASQHPTFCERMHFFNAFTEGLSVADLQTLSLIHI